MIIADIRKDNFIHVILFWENYGITCPSLVTTNGSAEKAADTVIAYLRRGYSIRRLIGETEEKLINRFFELINQYLQTQSLPTESAQL